MINEKLEKFMAYLETNKTNPKVMSDFKSAFNEKQYLIRAYPHISRFAYTDQEEICFKLIGYIFALSKGICGDDNVGTAFKKISLNKTNMYFNLLINSDRKRVVELLSKKTKHFLQENVKFDLKNLFKDVYYLNDKNKKNWVKSFIN